MTIKELFQDPNNRVSFIKPQFAVSVGGSTKSVTNPTVVAWTGVNLTVLDGPDHSVMAVKKSDDPNKVGTHYQFLGTFRTANQEIINPGGFGQKFEPTLIARIEISGDLNRWRPRNQGGSNNGVGNYDGSVFAEDSESFSEDAHWFYIRFGNHRFATNPTPVPWPNPA